MDILGSLGQMYMFILLALLFTGAGLAVWAAINHYSKKEDVKPLPQGAVKKGPQPQNAAVSKQADKELGKNIWLKITAVSLAAMILLIGISGFLSGNKGMDNETAGEHQGHHPDQQNVYSSSMASGNGYQYDQYGYNQMSGYTYMNNGMQYNPALIQQQLNEMQMQFNAMHQQIMNYQAQNNSINSGN